MTMKYWNPIRWSRPVNSNVRHIRVGDCIHNPVSVDDTPAARLLADQIDEALAERGLRLDHTSTCIGFVEAIAAHNVLAKAIAGAVLAEWLVRP